MKITREMVSEFNNALKVVDCIFRLEPNDAYSYGNMMCYIVPACNMFIKSSIINPSDEFYTVLENFFRVKGISKLQYNNTGTVFWSADGWEE